MARECTHCGHINSNMRQAICPRCVQPYGRDAQAGPGMAAVAAKGAASAVWRISRPVLLIFGGTLAVVMVLGPLGVGHAPTAADPASLALSRAQTEQAKAAQARIDEAISLHLVLPGMTAAQARASWGDPRSINATTTARGTSEQWVYRDGGYLYLDNGIVRSVQTSR